MKIGQMYCENCGQPMEFDAGFAGPDWHPAHWYCDNGNCVRHRKMFLVLDCQVIPSKTALIGGQDAA